MEMLANHGGAGCCRVASYNRTANDTASTERKAAMKVAELMTTKLHVIGPDDSVEGAVRLLQQQGVRHLLVVENRDLVGILSDRDLKRALDPQKRKRKKLLNLGGLFFLLEPILVREIMTN